MKGLTCLEQTLRSDSSGSARVAHFDPTARARLGELREETKCVSQGDRQGSGPYARCLRAAGQELRNFSRQAERGSETRREAKREEGAGAVKSKPAKWVGGDE